MAVLLLWLGVSTPLGGCLAFEDYPVLPDLPPKKNSPLRILPTGFKPEQQETTVTVGANCARTTFSVQVADEDYGDSIRSLWFVAPGPTTTGLPGNPVLGGNTLERQVNSPNGVWAALTALADGNAHRVEVLVTDGEFEEVVTNNVVSYRAKRPDRLLPDGTTLPDTAYTDSFLWLVTVQSGACP